MLSRFASELPQTLCKGNDLSKHYTPLSFTLSVSTGENETASNVDTIVRFHFLLLLYFVLVQYYARMKVENCV